MKKTTNQLGLIAAAIGSPDFCRRLNSILSAPQLGLKVVSGSLVEGWGIVVSSRPNMLFLEIGINYSDRQHAQLRRFLAQMRERFGHEVYTCVVLAASDRFAFGGDLLFENETEQKASDFVDTFVAVPPGLMPSIPNLTEQILNVVDLCENEFKRRSQGSSPLPALNTKGWVTSLVDPQSRELWMKWLPRYASYTNENPIIIGPTGTGKTNLAQALHILSGRKGEFVAITPRDFSSSELVQAELFGAVAGAYTGAVDKWGLVKRAEKGTLFIDELQSIDKDLQGKLITFIENKAYRRVGSAESVSADVRFVFASNRTLYDMMETNTLRDDFAYRLERVQLELSPLNLRKLDIVGALAYELAKIQRQRPQALPAHGVSSGAYRLLFAQRWPGNLRQLENTAAQLCEVSDIMGTQLIDETIVLKVCGSRLNTIAANPSELIAQAALKLGSLSLESKNIINVEQAVTKLAELVRVGALEASGGNATQAAELVSDSKDLIELTAQALLAKAEVEYIR